MPRDDITGFILAGGKSRRMGRDKRRIGWGTETFALHAIRQMQQVTSKVFVVGAATGGDFPIPVLIDAFPGCGPMAGLETVLAHTATDWNLVLAVDMPLVTSALLGFLAERCNEGTEAVVIRTGCGGGKVAKNPSMIDHDEPDLYKSEARQSQAKPTFDRASGQRLQPLCAAYHRCLLPRVRRAVNLGELSIQCLLEEVSTSIIEEPELILAGFQPELLLNVNTPEDLERARMIAQNLNV